MDKYEYLTDEDLDLKPSTVDQAKFEYSPLGKIFNKGLDEEDKKAGLFKRLENIKDKSEEILNAFSVTNKVSKAPKNKVSNKNLVYIHIIVLQSLKILMKLKNRHLNPFLKH